jgi:Putative peptidase family
VVCSDSNRTPVHRSSADSPLQVHQKLLLVYGEIGDPQQQPLDGNLTVHHHKGDQAFPCTNWPVSDSYFKALVYLSPGWNQIRFDFTTASLSAKDGTHSSFIMLNYLPLNNAPPLHLAIIVGKDSHCTYDAPPERKQREGNGLDTAIRKYRMAAHLWQAFTAEQMYRNKFGRRCFRFDEEWQTGTLSLRDWESGKMKNEIKIHVIRSEKTVAQIQDLQLAQQYRPATNKGDLFGIASEAIQKHFRMRPGQKQYVAALFLDSHWDTKVGTIRGHAALGGTNGDLQLGIFGSHALHSYPSCVEEVVPAFTDCTKTDTRFVANDCNESGSNWEAANIGIGAHMHEVGHLFSCPHQESGVMLRDYVRLNRTFLVREPYATRTQQQGLRVCRIEDECAWHRLDLLRFRFHPCFRGPNDLLPHTQDDGIQFYPLGNGKVTLSAPTGITFIEIYPEGGDEFCRTWLEYAGSDPRNVGMPSKVTLSEADLRSRLPAKKGRGTLKLQVFSGSSANLTIDDFCDVLSKSHVVNLPARRSAPRKDEGLTMNTYNRLTNLPQSLETRQGFKGKKLGHSQMDGSKPQEIILDCTNLQTKLLTSIKVYHGYALDGIEFCYEDKHSQLFGKRGGKPGGDEFFFGQ